MWILGLKGLNDVLYRKTAVAYKVVDHPHIGKCFQCVHIILLLLLNVFLHNYICKL